MAAARLGGLGWVGLGWVLVTAALVLRAGYYPAAMTGDEIWFAEAAWHWLAEGSPRRPLHLGALGSEIADYLPPVIALVQAVGFALLGTTQSAIGFPSLAIPLAVAAAVAVAARRLGAPAIWAAAAGLASLAAPPILRAVLYVRYEGLVAALFLGAVALLAGPRTPLRMAGAGFLVATAGLAYYPTAPAIGLAAVILLALGRGRLRATVLLGGLIGFGVPAVLFAVWVARHPDLFALQVLGTGGAQYLTFELVRGLADPAFWRAGPEAPATLVALMLWGGIAAIRSPTDRWLAAAVLVLALPALIYPIDARLLAPATALALATTARWADGAWIRAGITMGALAAAAILSLAAGTALWQRAGREYADVAEALDRVLVAPGIAAIDQRAWLALRARQPDRPILQVTPAGAPARARVWEPALLRRANGADELTYLVLDEARMAETIAAAPALAAGFASERFVEIARVAPPFAPLPWARLPPYRLVVYARRP